MRLRRLPLRAWSRGGARAARWLLTLCLLVFSAHHVAPDAPIWGGGVAGHTHHHALESASLPGGVAFIAAHEHLQDHCELCFGSAFQLPTSLQSLARPLLVARAARWCCGPLERLGDVGLPDAHAPPRESQKLAQKEQ